MCSLSAIIGAYTAGVIVCLCSARGRVDRLHTNMPPMHRHTLMHRCYCWKYVWFGEPQRNALRHVSPDVARSNIQIGSGRSWPVTRVLVLHARCTGTRRFSLGFQSRHRENRSFAVEHAAARVVDMAETSVHPPPRKWSVIRDPAGCNEPIGKLRVKFFHHSSLPTDLPHGGGVLDSNMKVQFHEA